jgi:hypothetical protein
LDHPENIIEEFTLETPHKGVRLIFQHTDRAYGGVVMPNINMIVAFDPGMDKAAARQHYRTLGIKTVFPFQNKIPDDGRIPLLNSEATFMDYHLGLMYKSLSNKGYGLSEYDQMRGVAFCQAHMSQHNAVYFPNSEQISLPTSQKDIQLVAVKVMPDDADKTKPRFPEVRYFLKTASQEATQQMMRVADLTPDYHEGYFYVTKFDAKGGNRWRNDILTYRVNEQIEELKQKYGISLSEVDLAALKEFTNKAVGEKKPDAVKTEASPKKEQASNLSDTKEFASITPGINLIIKKHETEMHVGSRSSGEEPQIEKLPVATYHIKIDEPLRKEFGQKLGIEIGKDGYAITSNGFDDFTLPMLRILFAEASKHSIEFSPYTQALALATADKFTNGPDLGAPDKSRPHLSRISTRNSSIELFIQEVPKEFGNILKYYVISKNRSTSERIAKNTKLHASPLEDIFYAGEETRLPGQSRAPYNDELQSLLETLRTSLNADFSMKDRVALLDFRKKALNITGNYKAND